MNGQDLKLEHHYRIATVVDTVQEAFKLVMASLDVIADDPQITISPIWIYGECSPDGDGPTNARRFEVSISGTPKTPAAIAL